MHFPTLKPLIFSFLFLFTGVQFASSQIRTYLQEIEACPDELFSMPVYVENLIGVDSFLIVINYDPAVLTQGGHENIHPGLPPPNYFKIEYSPGLITLRLDSLESDIPLNIGNDNLVFFRFTPVSGSTDLTWNLASAYYFQGQTQTAEFINGSVDVLPEITIGLVQIPEEVCPESFDASVIASIGGGTPPYTYQWIGSPIQVLSDSIARNLAAGGSYTLRITDDKGCVKDSVFTVKTRTLNEIVITAIPDTVFISNPSVVFSAENLSDPFITNYFWRFGDGDSINAAVPDAPHIYFNAKAFYDEGGKEYEVTLTVTNEYGCDTTIIYTILLMPAPIFVPNVFTPNGDGANDEFKIVRKDDPDKIISDEYLRLELEVFNRWGKRIFASDNYKSNWDGGNASDGVYFYVLKAIGFYKIDTFKGAVHIMR